MKIVQVSEAVDATLDWLVAKCEGHESRCAWMLEKDGYIAWQNYEQAWGNPIPKYSTDGGVAVLIIEREKISVVYERNSAPQGCLWDAVKPGGTSIYLEYGPTFLIAAMRCYVASKLGSTVEVPDEI
jgi:hypothetical protein